MKIQLIGNERAVRSMEAHVKSSSPAPLLISGETGLGQEELAMAAASELLNTERPEADGNFFMLRPENGSIRVEAVEELLDRSRISAHRGVRKVFAIIG